MRVIMPPTFIINSRVQRTTGRHGIVSLVSSFGWAAHWDCDSASRACTHKQAHAHEQQCRRFFSCATVRALSALAARARPCLVSESQHLLLQAVLREEARRELLHVGRLLLKHRRHEVLEKLPQLGMFAEVALVLEAQLHLWGGARRAGGRRRAGAQAAGGAADVSCRQGQRGARARWAGGARGGARTFFSLSRTCCSSDSTSMGSSGVYVAGLRLPISNLLLLLNRGG